MCKKCRQKKIYYNSEARELFNKTPQLFRALALGLEVFKQDIECVGVFTEFGDDSTGAANDLDGFTIFVDLAESAPFTEFLAGGYHQKVDLVLFAERLDKLGVSGLVAVGSEAAEASLAAVKSLGGFVETTAKAIVDESLLEHQLECIHGLEWAGVFFLFHYFFGCIFYRGVFFVSHVTCYVLLLRDPSQ